MDDITASIIVACQTKNAVASINSLGFAFSMLSKKAFEFAFDAVGTFRATQDATWKFNKVFANSMGSATTAVNEFMSSYNLSEQTAKSMLGDTASILKGAGMGEKAALKMSEQVARMGVDLASYTGYAGGAAGATEAITEAMLGNPERLKGLGTVISLQSDEYKDLVKNIRNTKNVSEQQAMAMAVLELVYRKNQDAIGDYMADGENFTQTIDIWNQGWKQLKSNVGAFIYETLGLNKALGNVNNWLKEFNTWFKKEGPGIMYFFSDLFTGIKTSVLIGYELVRPLFKMIPDAFTNIVNYGQWMNDNFTRIWASMADSEKSFFQALDEDITEALRNYVSWTLTSIPALAEKILGLIPGYYDTFGKFWEPLFYEQETKFLGGSNNTSKLLRQHGVSPAPKLVGGLPDFSGVGEEFENLLKKYEKERAENYERMKKQFNTPRDKEAKDGISTDSALSAAGSIFNGLMDYFDQYRSTMQTAVFADSTEGLRLQSRRLLSFDTSSPVQKAADGVKTLVNQGQQIMVKLNDLSYKLTAGNSNTNKLASAISGGRKY